jgi:hypothetical protein
MKNVGSPSAKRGRRHQGVFHRPSELNQDIEALPFLGEDLERVFDVPVKMGDENAVSAAALAWPEAHAAFFITLLDGEPRRTVQTE